MCASNCPFCRLALSHDERAIAALRRDVAAYRLLAQCAIAALAACQTNTDKLREQVAALRQELRCRMGLPQDFVDPDDDDAGV
jgi:hypothetical protein